MKGNPHGFLRKYGIDVGGGFYVPTPKLNWTHATENRCLLSFGGVLFLDVVCVVTEAYSYTADSQPLPGPHITPEEHAAMVRLDWDAVEQDKANHLGREVVMKFVTAEDHKDLGGDAALAKKLDPSYYTKARIIRVATDEIAVLSKSHGVSGVDKKEYVQ